MKHGLWVLGVFALGSCDLEVGQPRAERAWTASGQALVLSAQGVASYGMGIDGVGAPHAIGCLWPTVEKDSAVEVRLVVGDRPEVVLRSERVPELTDEAVAAVLASTEVAFAPDAHHVAWRAGGEWTVLELLAAGPPFPAGQVLPAGEADFSLLLAPELATLGLLADPERRGRESARAAWSAAAQQAPGPPWDDLALSAWPTVPGAVDLVLARAPAAAGAAPSWRVAAEARALAELLGDDHHAALDLAFALGNPVARVDALLLEAWPHRSGAIVLDRLDREPGPSPAWVSDAEARAWRTLEASDEHHELWAAELLLHLDHEAHADRAVAAVLARRPVGGTAPRLYEDHPRWMPPARCPEVAAAVASGGAEAARLDAAVRSAGLCQAPAGP